MNIIERYICSYAIMCLTGITGEEPDKIISVLKATKHEPKEEVLGNVLRLLKSGTDEDFIRKYLITEIAEQDEELGAILDRSIEEDVEMFKVHNLVEQALAEEKEQPKYHAWILNFGEGYKAFIYDLSNGGMKKMGVAKTDKRNMATFLMSVDAAFHLEKVHILRIQVK